MEKIGICISHLMCWCKIFVNSLISQRTKSMKINFAFVILFFPYSFLEYCIEVEQSFYGKVMLVIVFKYSILLFLPFNWIFDVECCNYL